MPQQRRLLDRVSRLYQKYREVLLYVFFGGLTTAVNYAVYITCFQLGAWRATTVPNLIAWVAAVLFAYATNRRWVFQSRATGAVARLRELGAFAGARVLTLLLETGMLWVAVDQLGWNNYVVKIAAGVLVIIINYLLSKFWIFRKKDASGGGTGELGEDLL